MSRAKKPATHPRAELYILPEHPTTFVAPDLDQPGVVWTWSAIKDGWDDRDRFRGKLETCKRVEAWRAFGSGWPGARPLPKPPAPPVERLTSCMRSMVSAAECQRYEIAAATAGVSVSAFLRSCLAAGYEAVQAQKAAIPEDLL